MTVCEGKAYEKGCIPKYKGQEEVKQLKKDDEMNYFMSTCGGFSSNNILKSAPSYTFIDGTIIVPYSFSTTSVFPLFLMDINGQKGPNKWGWDLFSFVIKESMNGSLYIDAVSSCSNPEEGGKTTQQMLRETR